MCRESVAVFVSVIAVVEWLVVCQWRRARDTPPTTSQYSSDTRSTCYSAAGEGELEITSTS